MTIALDTPARALGPAAALLLDGALQRSAAREQLTSTASPATPAAKRRIPRPLAI